MLWRLPAPVRSLTCSQYRRYNSTARLSGSLAPLNILFCGSDNFSIASLRALAHAQHHVPGLIHSIELVHRREKPTGRGLKEIRELPIKRVAVEELDLKTHSIDTFTGWTPPKSIDLVIAVSFGLFVPPRILNHAQYGGLNVHPSLLPDLRGPAPIEHAILKRRTHTGISIQTLHPEHFDQGIILAQTPAPGIELSTKAHQLESVLARRGADMLVQLLIARKFMPPLKDVGWYASSNGPVDHAPKITKQHHFIDFSKATMDQIRATHAALGNLWCFLPNGDRLIIHDVNCSSLTSPNRTPGIWVQDGYDFPLFTAACGTTGSILKSTYSGGKTNKGNAKLLRLIPAIPVQKNDMI